MKKWYAVMATTEDPWDNGSYDYDEAVRIAQEQGANIIAVIDENGGVCVDEIHIR